MTRLSSAFLAAPLAHRALHDVSQGRPENSRAAITAAMAVGYGIEIDVQLSSDGAAMVFHDYELDRLTGGDGALRLRDAKTLQSVKLIGNDEGIPTLPEVLDMIAGKVALLIELKDQDGAMGPNIGPLEHAVADALKGYKGPVAVMSFNPHSVAKMRALCPDIARGLVTSAYVPDDWPLPTDVCDHLRDIPDYDRVGACFFSHEASDLSRPRVRELRAQGAQVFCWTIRSPSEEAGARQHAHNITFEGYDAKIAP